MFAKRFLLHFFFELFLWALICCLPNSPASWNQFKYYIYWINYSPSTGYKHIYIFNASKINRSSEILDFFTTTSTCQMMPKDQPNILLLLLYFVYTNKIYSPPPLILSLYIVRYNYPHIYEYLKLFNIQSAYVLSHLKVTPMIIRSLNIYLNVSINNVTNRSTLNIPQ